MRVVSAALDAEVAGTSQGDRLEVTAWRGGVMVAGAAGADGTPGLAVKTWSLGWDASRQIQGQATLTIADPTGRLAPLSLSDALGAGGSRLRLTWVSGGSGIRVPLGSWRIRSATPASLWRVYGTSSGPVRVSGGAQVQVQADEDVTASATLDKLDAEAVPAGATAYAELARLLRDYAAVDISAAPADATIPPTYTYADSRINAVGDLLDMARAYCRVGPDGALQVVPIVGVGPVWTIQGGDEGALVSLAYNLDDTGVYNAAISKSQTPGGTALVGRAYLTTGPLAWGAAFGKVPVSHQAIATDQAGVDADAATVLATQAAAGTVDLLVTCLAHPGVQVHDLVTVVAPTVAGDTSLVGRVVAMSWSSAQSDAGTTPAKAMALTVRVTAQALEAVAAWVARSA